MKDELVDRVIDRMLEYGVDYNRALRSPPQPVSSDGMPPCNLYDAGKASSCLFDFLRKQPALAHVQTEPLMLARQQLMRGGPAIDEAAMRAFARTQIEFRERRVVEAEARLAAKQPTFLPVDEHENLVLLRSFVNDPRAADDLTRIAEYNRHRQFKFAKELVAYQYQLYSILARAAASGSSPMRTDARELFKRMPRPISVVPQAGYQDWGIAKWLQMTGDPEPVLQLLNEDPAFASRYAGLLPKLLGYQALQGQQPYLNLTAEQLITIIGPARRPGRGWYELAWALRMAPLLTSPLANQGEFQSVIADALDKSLREVAGTPLPASSFLSEGTLALLRSWANALYRGGTSEDVRNLHREWWKVAESAKFADWEHLALIAADLGAVEKTRLAVSRMRHLPGTWFNRPEVWIYLARSGFAQPAVDALFAPVEPTRFTKASEVGALMSLTYIATALTVTPSWSEPGGNSVRYERDGCPTRSLRLPAGPAWGVAATKPACTGLTHAAESAYREAALAAARARWETCVALSNTAHARMFDASEYENLQLRAFEAYGIVAATGLGMVLGAIAPPPPPGTPPPALQIIAQGRAETAKQFTERGNAAREEITRWQRYPEAKLERFRLQVERQAKAETELGKSMTALQSAYQQLETQGCR